ncbi:hypothetical protein Celaphus_00018007 [Cervus elaphus hippelaphus]|uniref:Uncharacterized protein n=1 Tax=Cervus elaphus hippelaphus TaxID=46360 RepID=A0A212C8I7_CEREH|nr:hypothetical protein Celaphus_00018007 [Cervus elaphus hippelaphus]
MVPVKDRIIQVTFNADVHAICILGKPHKVNKVNVEILQLSKDVAGYMPAQADFIEQLDNYAKCFPNSFAPEPAL